MNHLYLNERNKYSTRSILSCNIYCKHLNNENIIESNNHHYCNTFNFRTYYIYIEITRNLCLALRACCLKKRIYHDIATITTTNIYQPHNWAQLGAFVLMELLMVANIRQYNTVRKMKTKATTTKHENNMKRYVESIKFSMNNALLFIYKKKIKRRQFLVEIISYFLLFFLYRKDFCVVIIIQSRRSHKLWRRKKQ